MAENHDKMNAAMGTKLDGLEALNNETVDLVSEPGRDGGCCCCCCAFLGRPANSVLGCCRRREVIWGEGVIGHGRNKIDILAVWFLGTCVSANFLLRFASLPFFFQQAECVSTIRARCGPDRKF